MTSRVFRLFRPSLLIALCLLCVIVGGTRATAQTFSVLYSFTGHADGSIPYGGLVRDSAGNLYGTTVTGGATQGGVIFKLDSSNTETVLYNFVGGNSDGAQPNGDLVRDLAGNFYGTTELGGPSNDGTIFKLSPSNTESILYYFNGGAGGSEPRTGLTFDSAGHLYGTAFYGGSSCSCGLVFKVSPTTGALSSLYDFAGLSDGANPYAGIIKDSAGNLYGTNVSNGAFGQGVIYKLDASNNLTVLYSFMTNGTGVGSIDNLTLDSAGNLYGTTVNTGTNGSGDGVLFNIDTAGDYTVVHSFSGSDGSLPFGTLILDGRGNLYGTTSQGGRSNHGTIFRINASTGAFVTLHNFSGTDGATPTGRLIRDSTGAFYGTTEGGGAFSQGTVYKITP